MSGEYIRLYTNNNSLNNKLSSFKKVDEELPSCIFENDIESLADINLSDIENLQDKDLYSLEATGETKEYKQFIIETLSEEFRSIQADFESQKDSEGIISKGVDVLRELTGLGILSDDIYEAISKQEKMIKELKSSLNGNGESFEEVYKKYTGCDFSIEKVNAYIKAKNDYASALQKFQKVDENTVSDCREEMQNNLEYAAEKYTQTRGGIFGKDSLLNDICNKYSNGQKNFSDKLSTTISTAGIGAIVTGAAISILCPAALPVGIGLMSAGRYISLGGMFIDNAMDLVDNATDKNGLTLDEIKDNALETVLEAVSYVAGRKIGAFTSGINIKVADKIIDKGINTTLSHVLGWTTEVVSDGFLSLGADFAIAQGASLITNKEFLKPSEYFSKERFLNEGKNQLIGILTGVASTKADSYRQSYMDSMDIAKQRYGLNQTEIEAEIQKKLKVLKDERRISEKTISDIEAIDRKYWMFGLEDIKKGSNYSAQIKMKFASKLESCGFDTAKIIEFTDKINKMNSSNLLDESEIPFKIQSLDEKELADFIRIYEDADDIFCAYKILYKDMQNKNTQAQNDFNKLLNEGVNLKEARLRAFLTDTQWQRVRTRNLLNEDLTSGQIYDYSRYDWIEYQNARAYEKAESVGLLNLPYQWGAKCSYVEQMRANIETDVKAKYEKYLNEGYDKVTATILANIDYDTKDASVDELVQIINKLQQFDEPDIYYRNENEYSPISFIINGYIANNPDVNLSDFNKYLQNIGTDSKTKALLEHYSPEEFIQFADYHYRSGDDILNDENLRLDDDFSEFLKKNYLNVDSMDKLITAFPNISRNVGELPKGWISDNANIKEVRDSVCEEISQFSYHGDMNLLQKNLSTVLNKEVEVKYESRGRLGVGFKVRVEGADDVCLKVFYKDIKDYDRNLHGQYIEPQSALFANNHSDKFVKMFFGRVASSKDNDGFMVTQFLDDGTEPISTNPEDVQSYNIEHNDSTPNHNMIHNKIFDFGGMKVNKKFY